MLLTHTDLFTPVDLKHRVFVSSVTGNLQDRLLAVAQAGDPPDANSTAEHARLHLLAFESLGVAQILIDSQGRLVIANDRARFLFGLHATDIGRPIQDLELSYRPLEIRSHIEQAYVDRRPVKVPNIERRLPDGGSQFLDFLITPLKSGLGNMLGISITCTDVSRYHQLQTELQGSKHELETAYEELQSTNEESQAINSTNEELETMNEELQSSNEELETTNEELQSTNEELETMNEELQSTNEEIQAINDELRQKTEDLNRTNTFLQAVLTSLRAGVVVVDEKLSVLVWNHWAEDLWGLRSAEAVGQPLAGLDIGLSIPNLIVPIRACLAGARESQAIVLDATNRRGKAIKCRVTCDAFTVGPDKKGAIILMEEA